MAPANVSGRIYVSMTMISAKTVKLDTVQRAVSGLEVQKPVEARFEAAYERAWLFLFNKELKSRLETAYLGSVTVPPESHRFGALGRIRFDYVLVTNKLFGATAVDVHILAEHNAFDLVTIDDESTTDLVRLIHDSYSSSVAEWPPHFESIVDLLSAPSGRRS